MVSHLSFAPLTINLNSTLKVSPQRCKIPLHSHLACEESPSVFKCLRSTTDYAFVKLHLCFVCDYAIFKNLLLQAWDLILGYSSLIHLHWTPAQEDLVSLPVHSNSAIQVGQSSFVVATQKLPCHKPSTWFLLVVFTSIRTITLLWLVITFLIWKFGG
jgi:hypothetical protein